MRSKTPISSANGATGEPQTSVSRRSGKRRRTPRSDGRAIKRLPPPISFTNTISPRGSLAWSRRMSLPASRVSGRRTMSSHAPRVRSSRCLSSTVIALQEQTHLARAVATRARPTGADARSGRRARAWRKHQRRDLGIQARSAFSATAALPSLRACAASRP